MGIKMDLGSSDSQASSVGSVTKSRLEAYQSAITALSQFSAANSLQGSAYDSGKSYGQSVLTPLIQGAILYSEGLGQAVSQLPSKYRSEVGEESLDENQLTAEITAYEGSLASLRGLYRLLERDEDVSPSTLRGVSDRMDNLRTQIRTAQEKLNKLRAFAAGSNSVFTDLPAVVDAMNAGIAQIQTQFANFSGQFTIPSSDQLTWTETIKVEWEKKEQIDSDYQHVMDKLEKGEDLTEEDIAAIAEYGIRYPSELAKPKLIELLDNSGYGEISENYGHATTVIEAVRTFYLGTRIVKDSRGDLIFRHGTTALGQKLDKLLGFEKYYSQNSINRNYNSSKITRNRGRELRGQYEDMMDDTFHMGHQQFANGGKASFKTITKNTIKAAKSSGLSGATLGLSDIFSANSSGIKVSDSFKSMGKFGKGVAIANVAFSVLDVVDGMGETHDIAVQHNIKKGTGEYVATQAGGVAIDVGRATTIGVASTVGATLAVSAMVAAAPITVPAAIVAAGTVLAAGGISWGLGEIDKNTGFSKGLKNWWAGVVGGK